MAWLLAVGCATKAPIRHEGVPSAKVVHLTGAARCKTGIAEWRRLGAGDLVESGSILQTADKSRLELVWQMGAGQNRVEMWENTLLILDKLTATQVGGRLVTEAQLDLRAGHIFGQAGKLSAGSKYEVKLPSGVAAIREGDFDISAEGIVKVLSGSVVLAYVRPDGKVKTQVITGHQEYDAPKDVLRPLPGANSLIPAPRRSF